MEKAMDCGSIKEKMRRFYKNAPQKKKEQNCSAIIRNNKSRSAISQGMQIPLMQKCCFL
jgi:hypothetical protein